MIEKYSFLVIFVSCISSSLSESTSAVTGVNASDIESCLTHETLPKQSTELSSVSDISTSDLASSAADVQVSTSTQLITTTDEQYDIILKLLPDNITEISIPSSQPRKFEVEIKAFPPATSFTWYKNNETLNNDSSTTLFNHDGRLSSLTLVNPDVASTGVYRLDVEGQFRKSIDINVRVKGPPIVKMCYKHGLRFFLFDQEHKIPCNITADLEHLRVNWSLTLCDFPPDCNSSSTPLPGDQSTLIEDKTTLVLQSILTLQSNRSAVLTCKACTDLGCGNDTLSFIATDISSDQMKAGPTQVVTGDNVSIKCGGSRYLYSSNFTWRSDLDMGPGERRINTTDRIHMGRTDSYYSYFSNLTLFNVTKNDSGNYWCKLAFRKPTTDEPGTMAFELDALDPMAPRIKEEDTDVLVMTGEQVRLNCTVEGVPDPTVFWWKGSQREESMRNKSYTYVEKSVGLEDGGEYECVAENRFGKASVKFNVILKDMAGAWILKTFVYVLVPLLVLLAVVASYLTKRYRRVKKKFHTLKGTGFFNTPFIKGDVDSLDPDVVIGEQANKLPYDKKRWEFPQDKLKMGEKLGSGAFGLVKKAEAYELLEPGETTTVAVKMLKNSCDGDTLAALICELKIMIHLGKHVNVVNCLGACTRNICKCELLVLVEYCSKGSLLNYLQDHRNAFINQVNALTGEFDPSYIYPGFENSAGKSTGDSSNSRGSAMTSGVFSQATTSSVLSDSTQVTNTVGEYWGNTLDDGYEQPKMHKWDKTHRENESSAGIASICTQDLLCWSFQIARGMEYLASRKVLHNDLAARNVLLADDNVIKISDFGLSRNSYSEYKKKTKEKIPYKWMALESLQDLKFSTKSDVWSYGVTLWELFSLGRSPYPGMGFDDLTNMLQRGLRMDKPQYATKQMYKLMLECWAESPSKRPSFTQLVEKTGAMLEDSVRTHYIDMNEVCERENEEYLSQRDYLSVFRVPTQDEYTTLLPSQETEDNSHELTPMLHHSSTEPLDAPSTSFSGQD